MIYFASLNKKLQHKPENVLAEMLFWNNKDEDTFKIIYGIIKMLILEFK